MPVRQTVGTLFLVTALISGYGEWYLMSLTILGGPWSWWYPVMFGASIVLLVGGILTLLPRMRRVWLTAIAVALPLVRCIPFGLSWSCGIFAIVIGLTTWGTLALASAWKRASVVALIPSAALALWWLPVSVKFLIGVLVIYLSPDLTNVNLTGILWALTPSILVVASLIAGVALLRTEGASKGKEEKARPTG